MDVATPLEIPSGDLRFSVSVNPSRVRLLVARGKNPTPSASWEDLCAEAIAHPVDAAPISTQRLAGKDVAVITDDWGRPTPAHRVIPLILKDLSRTGVADADVTFVTASGMHDPMNRADLERKLGRDVVARFRCVSHDGGDDGMLVYMGINPMGTPVWINRYVATANYRIGLGRVYPHVTHGYEGGYKLILPGVASFEPIVRNHALNFSEDSIPGVLDNPSRRETDQVGRMVGMDFLINAVVNAKGEPLAAFAGEPMAVHRRAIEFGDREVWGAEVGAPADVTIASHGPGPVPASGFDAETLRRACAVTRTDGVVIIPTPSRVPPLPDWRGGEHADDAALDRLPLKDFGPRLRPLAFSELMRLHERRDWPQPRREIQWRIKAVRGEYYRRRWLMAAAQRRVVFTQDPQRALDDVLAAQPEARPRLLILPDGANTLPKFSLFVVAPRPPAR